MLCGTFKKYMLNKFAKDNNFDYVATGHNLDDESEAFMMNLFRSDYSRAKKQDQNPATLNQGLLSQESSHCFL
jgi:tRNA(Ile)-lysidine synthase TilS/MesJ